MAPPTHRRRPVVNTGEWDALVQRVARMHASLSSVTTKALEELLNKLLVVANAQSASHSERNVTLVMQLIAMARAKDDAVAYTHMCQLLVTLLIKKMVQLDETQLQRVLTELVFPLFGPAHREHCLVDAMRALSYALFENGSRVGDLSARVLAVVLEQARAANANRDSRRIAITCIGNLVTNTGKRYAEQHEELFRVVYAALKESAGTTADDLVRTRLLGAALRSLSYILNEAPPKTLSVEPELVRALQSLAFFGTPSHRPSRVAQAFAGAPRDTAATPSGAAPAEARVSPPRARGGYVSGGTGTSEDGEMGRARANASRVRANALFLIQAVAKRDAKTDSRERKCTPQQLCAMVPEKGATVATPSTPSLFTLLLFDGSARVRLAAACALTQILDGWGSFAAVAEEKQKKTATTFTSHSQKLGLVLREAHQGLLVALQREQLANITVQVLKCLSVLVKHTPYHRMQPGLLHAVLGQLQAVLLNAGDLTVHSRALATIGGVFDSKMVHDEVAECLSLATGRTVLDTVIERTDRNQPELLRKEALKALACMAHTYHHALSAHWRRLSAILHMCLGSSAAVKVHALRVLEVYCTVGRTGEGETDAASGSGGGDGDHVAFPRDNIELWRELLGKHIRMVSGPAPGAGVLASLCALYAGIPAACLMQLEAPQRENILAFLCNALEHKTAKVRSAACRAVGVFVLLAPLREHVPTFARLSGAILDRVQRSQQPGGVDNVDVRMKGVWALANLCESIGLSSEWHRVRDEPAACAGSALAGVDLRMFACSLKAARDDADKVKCNAVRALGNLGRHMRFSALPDGRAKLDALGHALLGTMDSSSGKVRWNSCYALLNVFHNADAQHMPGSTLAAVLHRLCAVLAGDANYKVRINAAQALSVPRTCEQYSGTFHAVLCAVITTLGHPASETERINVRYHKTLHADLVHLLFHVLALTKPRDFSHISDVLKANAHGLYALLDEHDRAARRAAFGRGGYDAPGDVPPDKACTQAFAALARLYGAPMSHKNTIKQELLEKFQERGMARR